MKTLWASFVLGLILLALMTCVGCQVPSDGPTTRPRYYHIGTPFVTVVNDVRAPVAKIEVWWQNSCVAILSPGGHAVVILEGCQYMPEVTLVAKGYDASGNYLGVAIRTFNTRRSYFPNNEPGRNFTWPVRYIGGQQEYQY